MRFLWLMVPIMLVFHGCGQAPKTYSKPAPPPTFDGKSLGNGIFYYTKEDLIKVATNNYKYLSNADDVKKLLFDVGFVKKEANQLVFAKLDGLNYTLNERLKKLEMKSFEYKSDTKEYLLGGRYIYINEFFVDGKTNTYKWPIRFIAVYDEATQELKGMYYNTYGEYDNTFLSKYANAAWFSSFHGGDFLNLDTNKTATLKQIPFYTFDSTKHKFSKSGNYFAKLLHDTKKDGNDLGILLYDLKNSKILLNKTFYYTEYSSGNLDFDFSEDEKYFIYKAKDGNFQVYDLALKTEVASFGKPTGYGNDGPKIFTDKNFVFAYIQAYKKDMPSINKLYVYDTTKKEPFCELDDVFWPKRLFVHDNNFNALYAHGEQKIYNLEKDNCYEVDAVSGLGDTYGQQGKSFIEFERDGKLYWFENGAITKKQSVIKVSITEQQKENLAKINKIKKYIKAGFEAKGLEMLKDLILNDEYDFFAKEYTKTTNFLSGVQEAYVNLLAFRRYELRGIRDDQFERSARNYIFFASRYGFKDLIPPFLEEYKRVVGPNPSKKQLDRIALYSATYLLDIGKDSEAYELLFESAPFGDDAKSTVKRFSGWNIGLMKDKKKLAVVMEMKESDLSDPEKKILNVVNFYDLNGNLVKKGEKPKEIEEEKKEEVKESPKEEAIKLLD